MGGGGSRQKEKLERKRALQPEDIELWAKIAKTARPLKKEKKPESPSKRTEPTAAEPAPARPQIAARPAAAKPPSKPRAAPLDRLTARQLKSGRITVEARLDLHGMRQHEAHAALKRFLRQSQAKGRRHVLIITGRGAAQEPASFYEERERGVLRQAVPRWLAEPEFAEAVVSFATAPQRLGGEGALYVRLRRARKSG